MPDNIQVDLSYGREEFLVNADPTRIQQALMNLATNARDAMPEGGGIRIELQSLSLDDKASAPVETMTPGRWIVLRFSDNGKGIPDDVLPLVFEPFFTTKESGVGLGLPQVYVIVKQHDGDVTIESEEGVGTTIVIYLPALAEPAPSSEVPLSPDQLALGQGETVLVVEDNPQTRQALVLTLEALNYATLEAENGRAALLMLEQHPDDVSMILSDAVMPEMGGAALLQALQRRGWSYPVVVVSGYLPPEDQQQLEVSDNFVTWLTKPVDLQELASTIATTLHRR
jgi:CheY-like chemotaxis protein